MKQLKQVQPTSKKKEEGLSYSVEVRDKEGQIIKRISAPSRSFVQQWNQMVCCQARGTTCPGVKSITGDIYGIADWVGYLYAVAGIGVIDSGIRVGKGTTAVAIDDFALEVPCLHGTGLNEFQHQAVTFTAPAVVGPTCSFTIKRILLNNSGATISGIREIGCYCKMDFTHFAMGFRDVLPGGVTVPDGGSITVTYTIAATV